MEPTCVSWTDLPVDAPMPLLERRRMIGEKAMISHIVLRKGCDVPMHSHENEQFSCVLAGRLRFTLGAPGGAPGAGAGAGGGGGGGGGQRTVTVSAGQVIHLPANLPHAAYAEEETTVLDVFAPPSAMTGIDRKR